jgi:hypothetical protein
MRLTLRVAAADTAVASNTHQISLRPCVSPFVWRPQDGAEHAQRSDPRVQLGPRRLEHGRLQRLGGWRLPVLGSPHRHQQHAAGQCALRDYHGREAFGESYAIGGGIGVFYLCADCVITIYRSWFIANQVRANGYQQPLEMQPREMYCRRLGAACCA